MWYINYPAYEKRAEARIHKYMEAQNIDPQTALEVISLNDKKTKQRLIFYTFPGEEGFTYEYRYDKSLDAVLLVVYDATDISKGVEVKDGMNHPPLSTDWVTFDAKGKIELPA